MRTAAEDSRVTELLREYDRACLAHDVALEQLLALGVDPRKIRPDLGSGVAEVGHA
jgi:hypothetical protein